MTAWYNEIDPFAAQWLRNLIDAGHIAPGVVDERSIEDIKPNELLGFTQCHFFAGIGVWSYALRLAGVSDDTPLWTGSCPCQPFSSAGKGNGFNDERHLWPHFQWLIQQCKPPIVFGEQVAAKAVEPWIDLVHTDMEAMGYAFGCVPFPSAGVGAPHIRDRAYWVGHASSERLEGFGGDGDNLNQSGRIGAQSNRSAATPSGNMRLANTSSFRCGREGSGRKAEERRESGSEQAGQLSDGFKGFGSIVGMADANNINRRIELEQPQREGVREGKQSSGDCEFCGVADSSGERLQGGEWVRTAGEKGASCGHGAECGCVVGMANSDSDGRQEGGRCESSSKCDGFAGDDAFLEARPSASPTNGFWRNADWLFCRDGKWRPAEPESFPLADGITNRVGKLRGYGNAINAQAAKEFIEAFYEINHD